MQEHIQRLRDACIGYPRQLIAEAVEAALRDVVRDSRERHDIAALFSAWMEDKDAGDDPPPVSDGVLDQIVHELRRRTH